MGCLVYFMLPILLWKFYVMYHQELYDCGGMQIFPKQGLGEGPIAVVIPGLRLLNKNQYLELSLARHWKQLPLMLE